MFTSDCLLLQLRSGGSQILEGCIAEIPNITSLDISDNGVEILLLVLKLLLYLLWVWSWLIHVCVLPHAGLDMDLTTLLVWLAKNRSIRHLSLGKNFNNIKSKWVTDKPQTWVSTLCFTVAQLLTWQRFPQECGSGPGQSGSYDSRRGIRKKLFRIYETSYHISTKFLFKALNSSCFGFEHSKCVRYFPVCSRWPRCPWLIPNSRPTSPSSSTLWAATPLWPNWTSVETPWETWGLRFWPKPCRSTLSSGELRCFIFNSCCRENQEAEEDFNVLQRCARESQKHPGNLFIL